MFATKTLVAVVAGMAVAGSVLAASPAAAAPDPGHPYTWGYNGSGQLGNGTTTNSNVPVAVNTAGPLAGKTITAISTGAYHSCAVADGKAYCWGYNFSGQLGNNSTTNSKVPVAVDTAGVLNGRTVTAIDAGFSHSCAVADGKAYCWGYNDFGKLGNGTTTNSNVPVAVTTAGVLAGKTITAISVGDRHSCAVADGKAYCWGYNFSGQLGNNSTTNSSVPVAVDTAGVLNGRTVTAIDAGFSHSCAVADGKAYCWGYNFFGQLGNNSTTNSSVPVAVNTAGVLGGQTITAITAGGSHSCAVADGGKAYCWGDNRYGQLGNGTTTDSSVPVAVDTAGVLGGKTITAISAGLSHSCAVADSKAYCWGPNGSEGRLGNDSTTDSSVPVAVDTTGVLAGRTVTAIAAGHAHSAVLAAAAPQPPTAVTGAPGDGQVSVSWAASADDGGSPLLDYTVTASPGGAGCATSSTACVVSGLTNGTAYTFTVTARNAIGTSTPSAPSAPVTPRTVPGAPMGVSGSPGNKQVQVSWSAPGFDGGGAITGYTATASPGGATCTTSGTSCDVTGLTNGTAYTVTVFATNDAGDGPPSDASDPVTPRTVPGAPTGVSGSPGNKQVQVSWSAPGFDGGAAITGYTATASPGGATCTTSGTSCDVTGLTNGTAYTVTVFATNDAGDGPPSGPSAPITPTAPPITPTAPPVTPTTPPVTPTTPPVTPAKLAQTAKLKVPRKIEPQGKTVLLKKAVTTNAGKKAKATVRVKPKGKKYAKVTITKKGKVTIKTSGKKKLKVTLKLKAPATAQYNAYSYTKTWKVKKV